MSRPAVERVVELPLLMSDDAARPFNHSAEPSIAVYGTRVVVASLNMHLQGTDTYQYTSADFRKRVAISVSQDTGGTFSTVDPGLGDGTLLGDETTDPVVRVARDGTFFVSVVRSKMEGDGAIGASTDGEAWATIAAPIVVDKPWIAVDDASHELFVGAASGVLRLGFDGSIREQVSSATQTLISDAYADASGAYFATTDAQILYWDGSATPPVLVTTYDAGADADLYTRVAWNYARLPAGSWSVRARRDGLGSIVLAMEQNGQSFETLLTPSDANAFFPVAAVDDKGRMHVVWYDSSGAAGRLVYTHSRDAAPFAEGFIDPFVIDDNATPGDGWYPGFDQNTGARRLREYIGLVVEHGRAFIAWTHSPTPPSRVFVATVRVD